MNLGLANARVLVTGSSRGIGRGIAEVFLDEGAAVVLNARSEASVSEAVRELAAKHGDGRVHGIAADFAGDDSTVRSAVDRSVHLLGGLDVVVANVGSGRGMPGAVDGAEWMRLIDLNLLSAGRLAAAALPALRNGNSATLIFIASIAGVEALGAPMPYTAAKAGIIALAKNLARHVAGEGIRVNTVSPGNVFHPGGSWEARQRSAPEEVAAYIAKEVPMNGFGTPHDIGSAVAFLASPHAAKFITGCNLVVDGGQTRSF